MGLRFLDGVVLGLALSFGSLACSSGGAEESAGDGSPVSGAAGAAAGGSGSAGTAAGAGGASGAKAAGGSSGSAGKGGSGAGGSGAAGAAGSAPAATCAPSGAHTDPGMRGVYKITAHTRNDGSCDAEGASDLDKLSDKYAIVFAQTYAGMTSFFVLTCKDPASCREEASQMRFGGEHIYSFWDVADVDAETLVRQSVSSGGGAASNKGICKAGGTIETKAMRLADGSLRVEERSVLADYPSVDGKTCSTGPAAKAAEGKPCSRYETLSACFVEGL